MKQSQCLNLTSQSCRLTVAHTAHSSQCPTPASSASLADLEFAFCTAPAGWRNAGTLRFLWARWASSLQHCETFSSWIMDVFHHNRLGDQKKRTSMIIHDHKWSPEFDPLESTSPSDHIQRLVIILKLEYPVIFMIAPNWITRIQSFLRSTAPPPDSVQGFGSEAPELVGTAGCLIVLKLWWLLHGYRLEI